MYRHGLLCQPSKQEKTMRGRHEIDVMPAEKGSKDIVGKRKTLGVQSQ
jgi:hypothetical protein